MPAKLRIPAGSNGIERIVPCTVTGCAERRLRITASEPVSTGTAVSVEYEDALLMGEVIAGVPNDSCWHMEIKLEQVLNGLMNLMALRARLVGQPVPETAAVSAGSQFEPLAELSERGFQPLLAFQNRRK